MGAEMEVSIVAKIIIVVCSVITLFVLTDYEQLLAGLRSGAKHAAKLMVTGEKHIAKATHHNERHRIGTLPRPKKV